jgi:hypothetical protein
MAETFKIFNKSHLPEAILYKNEVYYKFMSVSDLQTSLEAFIQEKKENGQKVIICNVLSNKLKGRLDLHNKPYQPTKWIFIYPLT